MHGSGWWAFIRYDPSRDKPQVDRALLRRVAEWARPYTGRFVIMVLLLLAVSLVELVPPLLYGRLIDGLATPGFTLGDLNPLAAGLLIAPIAGSILGMGQRYLSAYIGEGVIYDLRQAMYVHMQHMGLRFFTETRTGDIMARFTSDVVGAQSAVTNTIPNILTNVLTLSTTLAVMLSLEWRLTLIAVSVLPLFLLPTRRVGRMLRDIRREAAGYDAEMTSAIQETLNVSGALLVRTFGRAKEEIARFAAANHAVRNIGVRRAVIGRWFFLGLGVASAVGAATMYWVGGYLVLVPETITFGTIVTFAAYVNRLYGPISALSNIQVEFATSLVSFERVFEYLDLPIEIDERPGATRLETVAGDVTFEDVAFSYHETPPALITDDAIDPVGGQPDGSPPIGVDDGNVGEITDARARAWALADLDFEIRAGQLAALVGPSGAGKTTVGYLLARLYDPTRGRVTMDGHDLRDLSLHSVSSHIGVVTQETYLFHDTVRANLAFARPDATEAEIAAACRAANIHDLVSSLPDGYDTVVGERGYRLSGGEKQRLALARVILKDPRILILDEATSHLDSQSEALIQDALARVMEGRTSLVIAHRLSTILAADLILVLRAGQVVERGTHAELLDHGGLYAELFETQFRNEGARVEPDVT